MVTFAAALEVRRPSMNGLDGGCRDNNGCAPAACHADDVNPKRPFGNGPKSFSDKALAAIVHASRPP
jgi:hypothetical protein